MAIEVPMPDDVRKIKTKFKGFTKEQFKSISVSVGVFVGMAVVLPIEDTVLKGSISFLIAAIFLIPGWFSVYNQSFSVFMTRFFVYSFVIPLKRGIERRNEVKEEYIKLKKKRENAKIQKMQPKERKAYLKEKKKIVYSSKPKYKNYM